MGFNWGELMGGRKSYYADVVIGKSPGVKKKLISSAKSGSSKKTAQATINAYVESPKVISDLKVGFSGLKLIKKYVGKEGLKYDKREQIAKEFWAKQKKEKKLDTTPQLDHIIISSLTKSIPKATKRGRQK